MLKETQNQASVLGRKRDALQRLEPIRAEYPFEPHFFHGGKHTQHYVDEGPRDGACLFFVHGNPTWSFAWRRLIKRFSLEYRCVAPDHIGCGLSDKPQDHAYRLEQHIEQLLALVDALGLERITLVLHDWGGAIGMGLARRRPELVQRLVLMNTAAFRSELLPRRIAMCRIPMLGKFLVRGLNGFARAATLMAVQKPLSAQAKRGYLLPYGSWHDRIATHSFVEDIPTNPSHPSYAELLAIEESLASFAKLPICLFWGERDWCFTPDYRKRFQAHWPGAEVQRYASSGHYLFEDEKNTLGKHLAGFLARHPAQEDA